MGRLKISGKCLIGGSSLLALSATLLSAPAYAQAGGVAQDTSTSSQAANAETGAPSDRLEDIVVTARRTEERLQDTPISVTAVTSAAIEQRGLTNVSQVAAFAPNVQFSPTANISGSSSAASIFIRGVGQTDFTLTTEPGVGLYLDGVYIARSVGGVLDLVDIERIEVLRGPQGTLFGKNTIGGAINIVTQPPADEFGGRIEGTYGRFNRIDGKASIDVPLSDKVLTKFSIATLNRDGYARRLLAGDRLGGINTLTGRFRMLIKATDTFTIDLSLEGTRNRNDSAATTMLGVGDGTGPTFFTNEGTPIPASGFIAGLNAALAARGVPLNQRYFDENWKTGNPYTTNGTGPNFSNDNIWGASGTLTWELSDTTTLKSISAYRDLDSHFGRDADNSPLTVVNTEDFYKQWQFSQEVQLTGKSFDDRLNWIVGAYYLKEKGNNVNRVIINDAIAGGDSTGTFVIHSGGLVDNDSIAGFGQGTFHFTPAFSITAGLRYSDERKRFTPVQFIENAPGAPPILPQVEKAVTFHKWNPKVSAEYKWTPNVLTYASFSTGFKSGGFVQRVFPPRVPPPGTDPRDIIPSFDPETVNVYEVGLKSTLFDNRVRFNAAAFHTDYKNIQITVLDNIAPGIRNAGRGKIDGAELELEAVPTEGLNLSFGLGYTDARYTQLQPLAEVTKQDRFPNTSKWTLNGSASYEIPIGSAVQLTLRGDWNYRSSYCLDAVNSPLICNRGVSLFGAGAILDFKGTGFSLQVNGRNLTNRHYLTGGNVDLGGLGYAEGTYAPPREWSVTARYKF